MLNVASPVIIFRYHLLPYSETFIRLQAEMLTRYSPYYVGARRVADLPLPENRTLVINSGTPLGRVQEAAYRYTRNPRPFLGRLRQLKPALVHAHFGPDGIYAMKLAQALDLPLIVTFHGYEITTDDETAKHSFYMHRLYVQQRAQLQKQGALFIGGSEFAKAKLLEQGYPPERTVRHYYSIDTQIFSADPTVQREPIILFVGRLTEKKGCEYLIRAAAKVQSHNPAIRLVIAGQGTLRPQLEQLATQLGVNCEFVGRQTPEQVKQWMNRASVFCVPSIVANSGDAETFGVVFAEAQAMHLPVVACKSGGIPEVVLDGETGFLVAERDVEQLADHILTLLSDSALWQRFSEQGRQHVVANFDICQQTSGLEKLYDAVRDGEYS